MALDPSYQAWRSIATFLKNNNIYEQLENAKKQKDHTCLNSIITKTYENVEINSSLSIARPYKFSSLYSCKDSLIDRIVAVIIFREFPEIIRAIKINNSREIKILFHAQIKNKSYYLSSYILHSVSSKQRSNLIKSLNIPSIIYCADKHTNEFIKYIFKTMSGRLKLKKLKELSPVFNNPNQLESPLSVAVRTDNFYLANFLLQQSKDYPQLILQEKCNEFGSILAASIWNDTMELGVIDEDPECSAISKGIFAETAFNRAQWFLTAIPATLKAKVLLWQKEKSGDTLLHHVARWVYPKNTIHEMIGLFFNAFEKSGAPIQNLTAVCNNAGETPLSCCATKKAEKIIRYRLSINR